MSDAEGELAGLGVLHLESSAPRARSWRTRWALLFACLAVQQLSVGCGRPQHVPAGDLPGELRPPKGAHVARSDRYPTGYAVDYEVEEPFPAASDIARVEAQIGAEWRPLSHLRRNSSIRSSRLRGWSGYLDAVSKPRVFVHQWWAEWENPSGDLLTYVLEYRSPAESEEPWWTLERPTTTRLEISASLEELSESRRGTDPGAFLEVEEGPAGHTRESMTPAAGASAVLAVRPLVRNGTSEARDFADHGGRTFSFDPALVLLDLCDVRPDGFGLVRSDLSDGTAVWNVQVDLTEAGAGRLRSWSLVHQGQHLGIFSRGRLVDAPVVNTVLSGRFLINIGASESAAKVLLQDLRTERASCSEG